VKRSRAIEERDERGSEAIAVDSLAFVEKVKSELGFKAVYLEVTELRGRSRFARRVELTGPILPLKLGR
jgi:hypothetical protein